MKTSKKIICYFTTFFVLLILWEVGSKATSPVFIPSPKSVFESLKSLIKDGDLFKMMNYSFYRITIASFISGFSSIIIGCIMKSVEIVEKLFNPLIKVIRFLPVTAFYPILVLWFGIGEQMKIAFLFIATFVYMLPSVLISLNDVDQYVIESASVEGANKLNLILRIILPMAAPSIAQSFAMMYGIGYTYIAVAEQTNAKTGLGYLIYTSTARGMMDMAFVGIISIVIISILFDLLSSFVIKKIFNWKFS